METVKWFYNGIKKYMNLYRGHC